MVIIEKFNETFARIDAEDSTIAEMKDAFSFYAPNYQYTPQYRNGWNGKSCVLNIPKRRVNIGLLPDLTAWLDKMNYPYQVTGHFNCQEFSRVEALEFIESLNLPKKFQVREYQLKYFIKSVRNQRMINLSPTSSGKSLLIYLLFRFFNRKTLLVVPTIGLVTQMFEDFKEYGYDSANIHKVYGGQEKVTDKILTVSTWQSVWEQDRKFFKDFKVMLGDEAHGFGAKSLVKIMTMMDNTPIRIGFTGTFSADKLSNMTIQGLFGPVCQFVTTKELMDQKYLAPVMIRGLVLKHMDSPYRDNIIKPPYEDEIIYLITEENRNRFIRNLAVLLKGNTFVMFRLIDHGEALFEEIKAKAKVPVYYVDGSSSAEERESIRQTVENSQESITVCSTVFTTGINIRSINNIIFTHPSKSRIKVLQSIGRGLRQKEGKERLTLFDIADDICDGVKNDTLSHFFSRVKIYKEEKFDLKLDKIDMYDLSLPPWKV